MNCMIWVEYGGGVNVQLLQPIPRIPVLSFPETPSPRVVGQLLVSTAVVG